MRISRTLAIILGIEEWNEQQYFPVSSPNTSGTTTPYLKQYYDHLSKFNTMITITDAEMKLTEKVARELYPVDNSTLKPEGVNAAKMILCGSGRSFVYNIIGRNYEPHKSPYRPAMSSATTGDGKQPWYSGPHFYGSTHRWNTPPTVSNSDAYKLGWDEGQYVDLIVCITKVVVHSTAALSNAVIPNPGVAFSSDTFYNDTSLYTKTFSSTVVPLPQHTSIACKYIPRGVPLHLSYFLRNTEYLRYTIHIQAPNLIYPNTASGRLESMVDIIKTNCPSIIKPWTAQWIQTIRPKARTVHSDLIQNRLLFKVDIIRSASTQVTLSTHTRMSDEAIKYYAEHSKITIVDDTHAPIGLTFMFYPILYTTN